MLGVFAIGIIGSLAVTGIGAKTPGNKASLLLETLRIENQNLQSQVAIVGVIAAILLIIKTLLSMYFGRRILFFVARRGAAISSELIRKYLSRSLTNVQKQSTQEAIYSLTQGVNTLTVGLIGAWASLIADIALLTILGIGLVVVDVKTSIFTFLLFATTALTLHYFLHQRIEKYGVEQARLTIQSNEMINEAILSYRELIVRNRRSFYGNVISRIRFRLAEGSAKIAFMQNLNKYVLEIAMVVTSVVLAAYQFSTQTASKAIAIVTIFVAASVRITPALLRVQQGLLTIRTSTGTAQPTIELINEVRNIAFDSDSTEVLPTRHEGFKGEVHIKGIDFAYEPDKKILDSVSLSVQPGEYVGIVGESGAGKTTLVDLLLGVITPDTGKVEISGLEPLSAYRRWPGAVAYIPQDVSIINGTIRENIGLGFSAENISDSECWRSLEVAQMDEYVRGLPDRLEHKVGERGTKLSGGQRQRLGIARAMVTEPRLLILDEATSSLDGVTENEITSALRRLRGDITMIVIAHRLSTVIDADRVIFIEKGRILAEGTFDELRAKVPKFRAQAEAMGL